MAQHYSRNNSQRHQLTSGRTLSGRKPHRSMQLCPRQHPHAVSYWAVFLLSLHLTAATPTILAPAGSPYFGPYLLPEQLPDGALLPLCHATWRIAGSQLAQDNFTAAVQNLTHTMLASYSFHGEIGAIQPSQPAPTTLDGQRGEFV